MAREYKIGLFTEKVLFLYPVYEITPTGERSVRYEQGSFRLCEVSESSCSEDTTSSARTSEQLFTLKTWAVVGVTPSWRVRFRSELYDVVRVSPLRYGKCFYQIRRSELWNE